jgi:hypothetical protein
MKGRRFAHSVLLKFGSQSRMIGFLARRSLLIGGLFIAVVLGGCSSSQPTSDSPSSSGDVLWLDTPPQCAFTEITRISGKYRNVSTFRSDQLAAVRSKMLEQGRNRGGDAVIKESIAPVSEEDDPVFRYEGRVIQFDEPDCRS